MVENRGKNKKKTFLFTGVPGFIGNRLLEEAAPDADRIYLLVLPEMIGDAQALIQELKQKKQLEKEKVRIIEGDITEQDLGLDEITKRKVRNEVTHFFHLAALYRLDVDEQNARRVNIEGTKVILGFLESIEQLERFLYVSTCYVSGTRSGRILEDELDKGQGFKNFYEATKFFAELAVRKKFEHIPTTIVRPAIVIGDSKSGQTIKYDGAYYVIKILHKGRFFILPKGSSAKINVVPVDFVARAIRFLAQHPETVGMTFHLADPNPPSAERFVKLVASKLKSKVPIIPVKKDLLEKILQIDPLMKAVGFSTELAGYFLCDAEYDTTNAQKYLNPARLGCPPLESYIDAIIEFYKANPRLRIKEYKKLEKSA